MKALLLHPSSYKKTILCKPVSILVLKRSMQRISRIFYRVLQTPPNTPVRSYATHDFFTPEPKTSSPESLSNNPPIVFYRKNKAGTVVQHGEWSVCFCDIPGCTGKVCLPLCGNKVSKKSIGHFTHSDKDEHNPQKLSDTDFDGKKRPVYTKPYEEPHDTGTNSYNKDNDEKKSEVLRKYLKNIKDDANNDL